MKRLILIILLLFLPTALMAGEYTLRVRSDYSEVVKRLKARDSKNNPYRLGKKQKNIYKHQKMPHGLIIILIF